MARISAGLSPLAFPLVIRLGVSPISFTRSATVHRVTPSSAAASE